MQRAVIARRRGARVKSTRRSEAERTTHFARTPAKSGGSTPFDSSPLLASERSKQLRVESDSRARERAQELRRHLRFHGFVERLPATMHGNDVVRINLLYRAHNVTHIVVLERREMKAAYNRMDLRNPRDGLRLLHDVDDATMRAG